jgi:hypothetical protein
VCSLERTLNSLYLEDSLRREIFYVLLLSVDGESEAVASRDRTHKLAVSVSLAFQDI